MTPRKGASLLNFLVFKQAPMYVASSPQSKFTGKELSTHRFHKCKRMIKKLLGELRVGF